MSESELTERHLEVARSWLARNGSVLFYGKPGTTGGHAVNTLLRWINRRRVLTCPGGHTDPDRPLYALAGLLSSVGAAEVAPLTSADRRILADSIFRSAVAAGPVPPTAALGPAVLSLLRVLSASVPLLLVIEAVHRLDRESWATMKFVAERSAELPVHMVAVEEVHGPAVPEGRSLCPPPLVMIRVPEPAEAFASDRLPV
jgi:hypothetical protein